MWLWQDFCPQMQNFSLIMTMHENKSKLRDALHNNGPALFELIRVVKD